MCLTHARPLIKIDGVMTILLTPTLLGQFTYTYTYIYKYTNTCMYIYNMNFLGPCKRP